MKNSIFIINPYFSGGAWIFDDDKREIVREPFVAGIPEMINHFTKDIKNAKKGFKLLFSANPMPDAQAHLIKKSQEGKGTWYELSGTQMIGWLCPVLYEYFTKPPANIYCRFEALVR